MSSVDKEQRRITRRDFVKGAAVGAVAVAGAGALASCKKAAAPGVPEKWDKEVDVVVVGAGGAGLTAAITAAVERAEVLVLEKLPTTGGTTAISGGWMWVPGNPLMKEAGISDSKEEILTYCKRVAEGQASDELIDAFIDRGPEMVEFVLANVPVKWQIARPAMAGMKSGGPGADYHPE
jgi:3-oxosteroid 1-dehydrogenase